MAGFLSNTVNNLPAEIHKIKCKYGHDDKRCEASNIKHKVVIIFLNRLTLQMIDNINIYFVTNIVNKILMESWRNEFLIHTVFLAMITICLFCCCKNVFIFMNMWIIGKNFNETSLPDKEDFYSHLNIEEITDEYYQKEVSTFWRISRFVCSKQYIFICRCIWAL